MVKLIFASANNHKLKEVNKVIDPSKFDLKNLKDVGIFEDIKEDGSTLEENALIKARFVYTKTRENVFSEDTGLEVFALGGVNQESSLQDMEVLRKMLKTIWTCC